jgi:predicted dehydrogenase
MKKPVTLLIIGAGGRGRGYAAFAQEHPDRVRIAGVAEPRPDFRQYMVDNYQLPPEHVFTDWKEAADKPRFTDAVIISTQDAMHAEPAVAFAEKGYAILLEKPMAPNELDCIRIVDAVKKNGNFFAVCHVMRYTQYTQAMKKIIDSGAIGEVVSLQHLEPVGYWHQVHSFVRGNWRNEKESSFMLLAKSCHDLDWIRYIIGKTCLSVSSFGNLKHFRKEGQPVGASDRCLTCGVEASCPYSASKIYLKMVENGYTYWPVDVLAFNPTVETVTEALRTGPYGRCVYACDNDVVDHQVVNMLFEGGGTGTFTMTAFTEQAHRKTRIFGTRGELVGDGVEIVHYDFLTDEKKTIDTTAMDGTIVGGHGGGDYGLMDRFIQAVAEANQDIVLSGPDESLETHRMVFAAEKARKEHRVVDLVQVVP